MLGRNGPHIDRCFQSVARTDDNPPAQNGDDDELFSVTLVVSRRPTA